jgi:hypothetical protein
MSKDIYTCRSCGITDDKVECGGIFHCPNPFCHGSGGAYFRTTLKSYVENNDRTHSVDPTEWAASSISYLSDKECLRNKIRANAKDKANPFKYFLELCT